MKIEIELEELLQLLDERYQRKIDWTIPTPQTPYPQPPYQWPYTPIWCDTQTVAGSNEGILING